MSLIGSNIVASLHSTRDPSAPAVAELDAFVPRPLLMFSVALMFSSSDSSSLRLGAKVCRAQEVHDTWTM